MTSLTWTTENGITKSTCGRFWITETSSGCRLVDRTQKNFAGQFKSWAHLTVANAKAGAEALTK